MRRTSRAASLHSMPFRGTTPALRAQRGLDVREFLSTLDRISAWAEAHGGQMPRFIPSPPPPPTPPAKVHGPDPSRKTVQKKTRRRTRR